jgi:hypothetical protein
VTSRGPATLEVTGGLIEVLGCPWVAAHAVAAAPAESVVVREFEGADDVHAFTLTCADKGYDQAVIDLDSVNWFPDSALIESAPGASWQAFLGPDTEQPGLWLAYTPGTGLVEGCHAGHDVMIPVDWANPATRTGAEEAQLARITAVRAALAGSPGTANAGAQADPTSPGIAVATGAAALPGSPTVRRTQPVLPPTTAAAAVQGRTPGPTQGRGMSR